MAEPTTREWLDQQMREIAVIQRRLDEQDREREERGRRPPRLRDGAFVWLMYHATGVRLDWKGLDD